MNLAYLQWVIEGQKVSRTTKEAVNREMVYLRKHNICIDIVYMV